MPLCLVFVGCGSVHQEDLDAWRGVPVAELDKHPLAQIFPMVRTKTEDGTEIRKYVNGRNVSTCSGNGSIFGPTVDMATFNTFSNCMQGFTACNTIVYIKDGRVQQVLAIGSGGARCYTNETMRPGYRGSINVF
jgi:hypothetical protein